MSTLDSMHAILHDPKHRPLWKRIEMLVIVFVLSGAWVTTGYFAAYKSMTEKIETLQLDHAKKLADAGEDYRKKLDAISLKCANKEIAK